MGFQWDTEKDAVNQAKHLISFRLIREDARRDYGERRFIALGEYDNEVLGVVYTLRDGDVRIISAWKANRHDRKAYATARQAREV